MFQISQSILTFYFILTSLMLSRDRTEKYAYVIKRDTIRMQAGTVKSIDVTDQNQLKKWQTHVTSLAAGPTEHKGTDPNQYLAKYENLTIAFVLSMSSADLAMAKFEY